jgi:HEPN domain-containing protein
LLSLPQCAEKYLKARLNEAGVRFGKIHELAMLLKLVSSSEPLWSGMEKELIDLTDFAVAVRYPGTFTNAAAAKEAFATCRRLRALARLSLGLAV